MCDKIWTRSQPYQEARLSKPPNKRKQSQSYSNCVHIEYLVWTIVYKRRYVQSDIVASLVTTWNDENKMRYMYWTTKPQRKDRYADAVLTTTWILSKWLRHLVVKCWIEVIGLLVWFATRKKGREQSEYGPLSLSTLTPHMRSRWVWRVNNGMWLRLNEVSRQKQWWKRLMFLKIFEEKG